MDEKEFVEKMGGLHFSTVEDRFDFHEFQSTFLRNWPV